LKIGDKTLLSTDAVDKFVENPSFLTVARAIPQAKPIE